MIEIDGSLTKLRPMLLIEKQKIFTRRRFDNLNISRDTKNRFIFIFSWMDLFQFGHVLFEEHLERVVEQIG